MLSKIDVENCNVVFAVILHLNNILVLSSYKLAFQQQTRYELNGPYFTKCVATCDINA